MLSGSDDISSMPPNDTDNEDDDGDNLNRKTFQRNGHTQGGEIEDETLGDKLHNPHQSLGAGAGAGRHQQGQRLIDSRLGPQPIRIGVAR